MKTKTATKRRATGMDPEAQLRAILDTAVDAIISIDEDGVIQSFNRAAERMFGYAAEEAVGMKINLLMPSPYREEHDQYVGRFLRTGKARIIGKGREVVGQRRNGDVFPMHLSISEVSTSGGRRMFVGIAHDITNRRNLEKALVMASEYERRDIGQDLHDVLGQQMTGISLLATALSRKQPKGGPAAELAMLAQGALAEVKRLSHGLYPVELERHGLCAALEELADNFSQLFQLDCLFQGPSQVEAFPNIVELQMYRIAQEAANNSVKHSGGSRIWIRLSQVGSVYQLEVEDDGKGPPGRKEQAKGMGLLIMRQRANMAGLRFEIRRGPAGGTLVWSEYDPGQQPRHEIRLTTTPSGNRRG